MKYITQEEYEKQLNIIAEKNTQKKYKQSLKQYKRSGWKNPKEKMETSKQLAIYLFVILNIVIVYCLVAMWWFADLTCLGILISDIAAQILLYGIYCLKAYKAKKSEEDIKYKKEKLQGVGDILKAGAIATEYVPVNGDITLFNSTESLSENIE